MPRDKNPAADLSGILAAMGQTADQVAVLYLAVIAFSPECCRFVIQSADDCYTENLARKDCLPLDSYPAPRSRILIVPRHYPASAHAGRITHF